MRLFSRGAATRGLLLLGAAALPAAVTAKAILGVDLGSLYMKVALVQRNSPLEIVTNLHSKRKTEVMVLFDQGTRFYGADANSMVARKPLLTPAAMSVMLGRDYDHPTVKVLAERHYPLTPSYNDTRSGVCLSVDGRDFTPEELVAMVLTHAKDITSAYGVQGGAPVRDCVLTVPSFYTQHERRALLDAAALADLNVLALIDENTAAALHFGIDRIDEQPKNILFYNMGASALQVSVVRYFSYEKKESKFSTKGKPVGAFEVLGKGWDSTLGGQAFDSRLVDHMADEFNDHWNKKRNDGETKDVRVNPRAMAKLRVQANKVKHVLSANNDMPVYIDALHDDTAYSAHINRATFEEICHDLLLRSTRPILSALDAANLTLDDVEAVELIGGGMRVPRVQEEIQKSLGGKLDLGMHINSDESMALGAAFHGANVSTAFRVRHVGMADVNPFPISISLNDLEVDAAGEEGGEGEGEKKKGGGLFGIGKKKDDSEEKEGDAAAADEEKKDASSAPEKDADASDDAPWSKRATIFKSFGRIGVKKSIAFTHDNDVHCAIDYEESDILPEGTEKSIERYNVTGIAKFAQEMAEKGLGKPKVSLQFELSSSGLTTLLKAEAVVEETIVVEEEVECKEDDEECKEEDDKEKEEEGEEKKEGEEAIAAEEKEKKESEGGEKEGEEKTEDEEKKDEAAAGDAAEGEEKKENETDAEKEKKKKKTKTVEKEKKKVHRRPLQVKTYHVGRVRPYSSEIMAESGAKLQSLAKADKDRMMLEESKNKVESYIYHIKNKMTDDEEAIGAVTNEEQRSEVLKLAEDAEEWMYEDGYDADLPTYEDKYAELSVPFEKIKGRAEEAEARPAAVATLKKKLAKIERLMEEWKESLPQVTEEERAGVLEQVEAVRKWVEEKEEEQAASDPWADPAFTSAEVPLRTKEIEVAVKKLSKKPKPKPAEEKNETETNKTTEEEGGGEEEKKEEEAGEEKPEGEGEETKREEGGERDDAGAEEKAEDEGEDGAAGGDDAKGEEL